MKTADARARWRKKPRHADKIESVPTIEGAPVRTITFVNPNTRDNFLRTYQKHINEQSPKKSWNDKP
jgi:hypothetical protein